MKYIISLVVLFALAILFFSNKEGDFAYDFQKCVWGYEYIYDLKYSNTWKRFWFIWKNTNWDRHVSVDWTVTDSFDTLSTFDFTEDSEHFYAVWWTGSQEYLLLDYEVKWPYDNIDTSIFVNSYWVSPIAVNWDDYMLVSLTGNVDAIGDERTLIMNWDVVWTYESVSWIWFSFDGTSYSYKYKNDWVSLIVKDWKNIEWLDDAVSFKFANYSNDYAIVWIVDWDYVILVNWDKIYSSSNRIYDMNYQSIDDVLTFYERNVWRKTYSNWILHSLEDSNNIDNLYLSADGNKYISEIGEWDMSYILKNNIKSKKYHSIIWFQANDDLSRYVFYWTNSDKKQSYMVIDWEEFNWYEIIQEFVMSPDWENLTFTRLNDWAYSLYSSHCGELNL